MEMNKEQLRKLRYNESLLELSEANEETQKALNTLWRGGMESYDEITGNESIGNLANSAKNAIGSGLLKLGKSALNKTKVLTGEAAAGLNTAFKYANRNIMVSYGTNGMGIKKLMTDLKTHSVKANYDIPSSVVGSITTTGVMSDFKGDLGDLNKTLDLLKQHCIEVDGYLQRKLSVIKDLKSAKDNGKVTTILNRIESISLPVLKFPHTPKDKLWVSEVLPGGKVFKFELSGGHPTYSMSGDKPSSETQNNPFNQDQWYDLLNQLSSINDSHKVIVKSLDGYVNYIKTWTEAVKQLSEAMEHMDDVSATFKQDMERAMTSDTDYLLFYSGFLPRVVAYTNALIAEVLRLTAKLI